MEQIELPNVPKDYVSDIKYIEQYSLAIVAAWDGSLSLYKLNKDDNGRLIMNVVNKYYQEDAILCCCPVISSTEMGENEMFLYLGTVQGEVLKFNLQTEQFTTISNKATLGVIKIYKINNSNLIVAGSWDGSLQLIDVVMDQIHSIKHLPEVKILTMDCDDLHLIIATTNSKIFKFTLPLDFNDDSESNETILDSGLNYQIRDIKLLPKSVGFTICSIDGRVAVEYFESNEKTFAFRCHRLNLTDVQFVFPVNTLEFQGDSSILFTGGSDGCISCWNLNQRKKIKQVNKIDSNSVVKIVYISNVGLLVATSDDSFKTNQSIEDPIELQQSHVYIIPF